MRKPYRFYSLNRPKLRQSWNKYNLYNIARAAGKEPLIKTRATFFQQKWAAKAKTRAYHGEHIPEKKWVRLFSRRLLSSVDLPPEYLARHDGSEQATGRGSGLSGSETTAAHFSHVPGPSEDRRFPPAHPSHRGMGNSSGANERISEQHKEMTPYMQMTFAPLERRLDTAVFRALFASSVRQARQFVIHGAVKMVHPSYQLNPGDMFQVEVEKVLYGTGAQKPGTSEAVVKRDVEFAKKKDDDDIAEIVSKRTKSEGEEGEAKESEEGEAEEASVELTPEEELDMKKKRVLKLRKSVRTILHSDTRELSARQKKELRLFRDTAQRFLSLPDDRKLSSQELVDELQTQIHGLHSLPAFKEADPSPETSVSDSEAPMEETPQEKEKREAAEKDEEKFRMRVLEEGLEGITDQKEKDRAVRLMSTEELSRDEMQKLAYILRQDAENPVDESKPYATPWRPRPFMSAFAFIPRYLEVNPNICAAVYLRHPVARKGMAEVPTPFSYLTNQLTHNWYLGRG